MGQPDASQTSSPARNSGEQPREATTDDGTRLTGHVLWDESARPSGPESGAEVSYRPVGVQVANHLIDVHDMLRDELRRLREVVAQVELGRSSVGDARATINGLTLTSHNWALGAYCANFCRVVTGHHGLEDGAIFPHLRQADPDLVPVVDRLADEHLVIHGVVESIDRALVAHLDGTADVSEVRAALDLLTDTLLSHLAYEERELLGPLARFGFYAGQV